ncbi:uncharacterized protein LOC117100170 isoform X2 [Anneissia japonica]|uniref:uncharacterized protein LOC117100170 isoform X2 n=1 Tax=Anneissia japonica TaxID=1529436 RepID=UPI0014254EDC|nr:uncharacterized protein LOC117100170 isoform X2 [Anneissia japonica]
MDPLGILTGPYTLKSVKPCDLSSCTKKDILEYFENSYSLNESIFTSLKEERVLNVCPDRLRLPLVFYLAHTATVYVNKLMLAGLIKERVDMEFETLFETGVDEMSWDDTENYRMGGSFKWPSLKAVASYRLKVRNLIRKVIEETPLELPITMDSPWWAVLMGIDHERIHIETSSVLIRQLPIEMICVPQDWKNAPRKHKNGAGKNAFICTKATDVTYGKPVDFPSYGWYNEYPQTTAKVPAFKATKYLITNQEFLEFVEDGGYEKKELWSNEGWTWRCFRDAKHPTFWVCSCGCKSGCGSILSGYSHCKPADISNGQENGNMNGQVNGHTNGVNVNGNGHILNNNGYGYRTMTEVIDLPGDWPVDVNYHEAKAYCAWKGPEYRLPSEAEHKVMQGNQPVNMFPANEAGFHDMYGNVWEWSEDHFNGFPNSDTHPLYDDFATPTYDGFHNVIMGGSWASTGQQASRFGRFAFRRHFFQHLGFRLACNIDPSDIPPIHLIDSEVHILSFGHKENPSLLPVVHKSMFFPSTNKEYLNDNPDEMLYKQYGISVNNYYDNLAEFIDGAVKNYIDQFQSTLVLGCATGRLAFHLAQTFSKVIGVDYSSRFLEAAIALQNTGTLDYPEYRPKGVSSTKKLRINDSWSKRKAIVPHKIDRSRVVFKQLTWIPNELMDFNLVVLDFLDRVMNIEAWLLRLWEIIVPCGLIIITSPTEWNEERLYKVIGKKLQCVDSTIMMADCDGKDPVAKNVTIWQRK